MNEELSFKVLHIGINCEDENEADQITNDFKNLFFWEADENPNSYFLNNDIEVLKYDYLGKNGHIAIGTNDIKKAMKYLNSKGISFNQESAVYTANNDLKVIYMNQQIGGFALHLTQL
ncbi:hypothetical protein ACWY2R_03625 [Enterococcus avium]